MIGLVYHELFASHGDSRHPENGRRLRSVMQRLEASGWLDRLTPLEFAPATPEQLAWLHDPYYVEFLESVCESGGEFFPPDTIATADTFRAAALAAGGCIAAMEAALGEGPRRSLCLVRPPGHHALRDGPKGFCFFNNAGLAAEAAVRAGLERVAVVDFDVHHGNGTQDAFYHRRDVLYISLHEYGAFFPGTGSFDEVGVDLGAGFNVNIPLLRGAADRHIGAAFVQVVIPLLEAYQPEAIVVSAGFDGHHSDPLAHLNLSLRSFHAMMVALRSLANRHSEGRLVMVLEGGYDLHWLPPAVENSLRALAEEPPLEMADRPPEVHPSQLALVDEALEHVIAVHRERLGF